jgi:CRISPR system Cascade subunit CasC
VKNLYIQVHQLRSFPPHIPNRGADGLAKRAYYGGAERQRISYQCHGYALRHAPAVEALAQRIGQAMSLRSVLVGSRKLQPDLQGVGLSEEDAKTWGDAVMGLWRKEGATITDEDQPLVIGQEEIRLLVGVVRTLVEAGQSPDDLRALFDKPKTLGKAPEEVQNAVHALKTSAKNAGFDGALFGRMATGVAVSTIDRAVRLSDWLTTHAIAAISDFFSTTDDLKARRGAEKGGGHIGTRELGAGIFYQQAVIDLRQLMANFAMDESDAAEVVEGLIGLLYEVDPKAHGGIPVGSTVVEMLVEVSDRQPRSLMDAFSDPVGTREGATKRLREFAEEQDTLGGAPEHRFWLREHTGAQPAYQALAAAVAAVVAKARVQVAA